MTTPPANEDDEQHTGRIVAVAIACLFLGWALYPENPYGYYLFMRWVVCGICIYLTVQAVELDRINLAWVFGITGILYNPIVRVHATREIWSVVNVVTIVVLIVGVNAMNAMKDQERDEW